MAKKGSMPPRSFWRAVKNKNRPVKDCLRDYWAQHPELAPPADWTLALQFARRGDPELLIDRIRARAALSDPEIDVITAMLDDARDQQYLDARLHRIEQARIGHYLEELEREGVKRKPAITKAMKLFNCTEHVAFHALRAYKKSRGKIVF